MTEEWQALVNSIAEAQLGPCSWRAARERVLELAIKIESSNCRGETRALAKQQLQTLQALLAANLAQGAPIAAAINLYESWLPSMRESLGVSAVESLLLTDLEDRDRDEILEFARQLTEPEVAEHAEMAVGTQFRERFDALGEDAFASETPVTDGSSRHVIAAGRQSFERFGELDGRSLAEETPVTDDLLRRLFKPRAPGPST